MTKKNSIRKRQTTQHTHDLLDHGLFTLAYLLDTCGGDVNATVNIETGHYNEYVVAELRWSATESDQEWQDRLTILDEKEAQRSARQLQQAQARKARAEAHKAKEEAQARVLYESLKQRFDPLT